MTETGVGKVVDPTKNVLDLVEAESHRQDGLREAESKFQNAMRDAETRRLRDLADLTVRYQAIIEQMRQTSLDSTSTLLATQLKETKNDLSDRMSKQEQFRWETGGRGTGRSDFLGWIVAAVVIAGFLFTYLADKAP